MNTLRLARALLLLSGASFLLSAATAWGQFQLRVASAVDSAAYPALAVTVQCTLDGAPTTLDDAGVLIASSRYSIRPLRVETLDAARGLVRITWLADPRLQTEPSSQIIAWKGSIGARDSVRLPRLPIIRTTNQRGEPVEELNLGIIPPAVTTTTRFYLQLFTGRYNPDGTNELPITVDSIVSSSPIFRVEWVGWSGQQSTLPATVYSPLLYLIRVHCTPPDTAFYSGTVTIYYDGALSHSIPISCNQFALPAPQPLRFVWPQGGELLSPCNQVTIRWTGMAPDARVVLDYSLDDGSSWVPIAMTSDSSAPWTVPNAPTSQLRLRLRQIDAQNRTYSLSDQNPSAVTRITFRSDGKRLLTQHAVNGEVVEWDIATRQILWRSMPPDLGQLQPVLLAYVDSATVVSIYNAFGRGYAALFRIGQSAPVWNGQILGQAIQSAALDTSAKTLAILGVLAPSVELFRIEQAAISPLRSVPMPVLTTSIAISSGMALVALRDSRIQQYRLPEWSLQREYAFPFVPHVALLHLLPDGKRLALGCFVSQTSVVQGFSAPVFVLDLPSGQMIRSDRHTASTPVAVTSSADARYLVFGFRGQPQSPLWDLATNMFIGQASTHQGTLADVQFSPDQRYVASSSATPPLELVLRTFLFPATTVSPALTIGAFSVRTDTLTFAPIYAYASSDTVFRGRICNNGTIPLPLTEYWIEGEPTFQLLERIAPDTLRPGECTDIVLRFSPRQARTSTGFLVVHHCDQLLRVPLQGSALPRSVSTPDTLDLGVACVGVASSARVVVLTNNDPAPLPIGGATIYDAMRSPFRLVAPPRDTLIEGKSALLLTIEFVPRTSGPAEGTLYVYYGWRDYTATIALRGMGVGGTLQPHVSPLPFIPEEPIRRLRLRNGQAGTLQIADAWIEPPGGFRILGSVPAAIEPGDSASIAIEWINQDSSAATLILQTDPCGSELRVPLVRFSAQARLRIPTVRADVRGRVAIPILVQMVPNYDYGDPLLCTLRIATHPRLFLPDTATAATGTATLLGMMRENNRRMATIAVRRHLVTNDTLAILAGYAALGEQDTSEITFAAAPYWGRAVTVVTEPGLLQLEGLCGDRRTIESSTVRMSVYPTPTSDPTVTVVIESDVAFDATLSLYTARGELVSTQPLAIAAGTTTAILSSASLEPGTYAVVVRGSEWTIRTLLVVVR